MTRRLIACLAGILLLFPGCQPPAVDSQNVLLDPPVIVPRSSVGGIKSGMTTDDIIKLLGEPQRRTSNALEYTRLGFAVVPREDKVVQFALCGDVTGIHGPLIKAFAARTKEGIGLTSTRDEVIKAYGEPNHAESLLGGRETLRYDSLGIRFSLEGGRVHHMIVMLEAAAEQPGETATNPPSSIEVTK